MVVVATAALGLFHPGARLRVELALDRLRAAVTGETADSRYRPAERCYQAGDFEKAEVYCQKALQLDSTHAPSKALFMEVQFILGRRPVTPVDPEYSGFMVNPCRIYPEQLLVEIDAALARGGERDYRKVLEFTKWLPTGMEVEKRRQAAREGLATLRSTGGGSAPRAGPCGPP